jgi:hypothetical protein
MVTHGLLWANEWTDLPVDVEQPSKKALQSIAIGLRPEEPLSIFLICFRAFRVVSAPDIPQPEPYSYQAVCR